MDELEAQLNLEPDPRQACLDSVEGRNRNPWRGTVGRHPDQLVVFKTAPLNEALASYDQQTGLRRDQQSSGRKSTPTSVSDGRHNKAKLSPRSPPWIREYRDLDAGYLAHELPC